MTTAAVSSAPRPSIASTYLDYGSNALTVNHTTPQREMDGMARSENPVAHALRTQDSFTRDQVAWLMAEAMRWGYERRVDEENAAWPADTYFVAGDLFRDLDRKAYREARDAAARLPRPDDFTGVQAEAPPLRVAA